MWCDVTHSPQLPALVFVAHAITVTIHPGTRASTARITKKHTAYTANAFEPLLKSASCQREAPAPCTHRPPLTHTVYPCYRDAINRYTQWRSEADPPREIYLEMGRQGFLAAMVGPPFPVEYVDAGGVCYVG